MKLTRWLKKDEKQYNLIKDSYLNDNLSDLVKKIAEKKRILEYNHELVRQYEPIYMDPTIKNNLSWRAHFFAPQKPLFGKYYDTYWYNIIVIWIMSIGLYITLYYELINKLMNILGKIRLRREKSK